MTAVPPITIGELTNVPAPGGFIQASWAQDATNRILHRFATKAALDSGWSNASNGSQALTLDTYTRWIRRAGVWEPQWPRLVSYIQTAAATTTGTPVVDVPGCSVAIPLFTGHRYWVKGTVIFNQTVAAGLAYLYLCDNVNNQIWSAVVTHGVGEYNTVHVDSFYIPGVAQTVKLRFNATSGTVALYGNQSLLVIDYGPA